MEEEKLIEYVAEISRLCNKYPNCGTPLVKYVDEILKSEKQKSFEEGKLQALELISQDNGWEQSRDYYAEKLELSLKYEFINPVRCRVCNDMYSKDDMNKCEDDTFICNQCYDPLI